MPVPYVPDNVGRMADGRTLPQVGKYTPLRPLDFPRTVFLASLSPWEKSASSGAYILKAKQFAESAFQSQKICVNLDIELSRQKYENQ